MKNTGREKHGEAEHSAQLISYHNSTAAQLSLIGCRGVTTATPGAATTVDGWYRYHAPAVPTRTLPDTAFDSLRVLL